MAFLARKRKAGDGDPKVTRKRSRPEAIENATDSEYSNESDSESNREHPSTPYTPLTLTTSRASSEANRLNCYHCPYNGCGRSFNRPCRLAEHIRTHTNERPFVCSQDGCTKSFRRDAHLKRHVISAHSENRKYACDWNGCEKKFATGSRLRRHLEAHKEKEQFRCTGYAPCNEIFRKHSTLQIHIKSVHLNQKPFPCHLVDETTGEPCTHGYETLGSLNAHIGRVHGGTRYACTICVPSEETTKLENGTTSLSIDTVGFPTYTALQAHIAAAHPPTCTHCGLTCASNNSLRQHIEIAHIVPIDERRNFPCTHPGCERAFTKRGNLNVHIQAVHNKIKRFVCGEFDVKKSRIPEVTGWNGEGACAHGFSTKANLEEHIRTQHLGLEGTQKGKKKTKPTSAARIVRKSRVSTLGKLTGVGYEESGRNIACLMPECMYRFIRDYDLEVHLKAAHWLPEEDIKEMIAERDALRGGPFWIGGEEPYEEQYSEGQRQHGFQDPYWYDMDPEEQEANKILDREMGIACMDSVDIRSGIPWGPQQITPSQDPNHKTGRLENGGVETHGNGMMDAVIGYLQHDEQMAA
ncbi:hypothetical protein AOQ84DRAFT_323679 [Glonium stellatum]|uniref:C2H2-type domain-containing protein n=1 Tax=Glonium stellatum TaxID=574774 RepID=A0A8E2EU44_9PEZI|nr:hypothetical protein AOQ84DRAFT_323679 [Glonium stellatum]